MTPDNTKAKMKTKKWSEEFDKLFKPRLKPIVYMEQKDLPNDLKSFIQSLLDNQRAELLEEIEKWRDKTPDADEYERADRVAWNQCIDEVRDLLTKGTLEQLDKGKR